jgi:two-component system sensor histidine kinase UhpB
MRVDDRSAYLEALRDPPDVVLSDHALPQFSALEALQLLRQHGSDIPFILVTGTQSEEVAAQCLQEGADDYLLKGNLYRLPAAIAHAVRRREAERARVRAEQERKQSAERYRMISEVASDFAYAARVDPDGKMTLEWATDAFSRVTGYGAGDVIAGGQNVLPVHPDDYVIAKAHRERLLGGHPDAREFRIQTRSGETHWVAVRARPVWDGARLRVSRIYGAAQDITEQRHAFEAVEAGREELRQLARRLQEVREEDRARISREIHDQLGQSLTGLKLDLAWVGTKLKQDETVLRERNDAMIALVDSTIETVRRIAADLRPGLLDDLGLEAAMEWQTQEFTRRSGVETTIELEAGNAPVPSEVSTTVFRIMQEALTNVARHAAAHHVLVRLVRDQCALLLTVEDDGRGLPEPARSGRRSLGILGMRERASALGGEVHVRSTPGAGTTVSARIPIPTRS